MVKAYRPNRVILPCCGTFSLAVSAVAGGATPESIYASDISVYSHALGHALVGRDYRLEPKHEAADVVLPWLDEGPLGKTAAIMFLLRVLQYERKTKKAWHIQNQQELLRNVGSYVPQLIEQLKTMAAQLDGINYETQDMWEVIDEPRSDASTAILLNPPRYTGGYDKMFEGIEAIFDWDEPEVAQFVERD